MSRCFIFGSLDGVKKSPCYCKNLTLLAVQFQFREKLVVKVLRSPGRVEGFNNISPSEWTLDYFGQFSPIVFIFTLRRQVCLGRSTFCLSFTTIPCYSYYIFGKKINSYSFRRFLFKIASSRSRER